MLDGAALPSSVELAVTSARRVRAAAAKGAPWFARSKATNFRGLLRDRGR